jgi:hypothetical protein
MYIWGHKSYSLNVMVKILIIPVVQSGRTRNKKKNTLFFRPTFTSLTLFSIVVIKNLYYYELRSL